MGTSSYIPSSDLVRLSQLQAMDYDALCNLDDVAVGVPEEVIKALRVLPSAPTDDTCPICLADYDWLDDVSALPCGHTYHKECVAPWLRRNKKCCVCKAEVNLAAIMAGR